MLFGFEVLKGLKTKRALAALLPLELFTTSLVAKEVSGHVLLGFRGLGFRVWGSYCSITMTITWNVISVNSPWGSKVTY